MTSKPTDTTRSTTEATPTDIPRYLSRENLLIGPAWRHSRVQAILAKDPRGRPRRKDDELIRDALSYRRLKRRLSETKLDKTDILLKLHDRHPDQCAADNLFNELEERYRYVLEARILAGQSDREINACTGIHYKAVEAYRKMYFDVSEGLAYKDWIASQVIAPVVQAGDRPWNHEFVVKFWAYFGGPLMLDALMYMQDGREFRPRTPDELKAAIDAAYRIRLQTQSAALLTAYQPSRFDLQSILGGYTSLLSLEVREKAMAGEETTVTRVIEILRDVLPTGLGKDAELGMPPHIPYDNEQIEPSPEQMIALTDGTVPEGLQPYVNSWEPPDVLLPASEADQQSDT